MKKTISKIRELLDELENFEQSEEDIQFIKNFDALEIPSILNSIVDLLLPDLSPTESVIYLYLFRHSILENGQQYARVGQAALTNITSSLFKGKDAISPHSVRLALKGLQEKGVISIAGDVTQSGTLYKVNLPDEIQSCINKSKIQITELSQTNIDEKKEIDYYNIAENRLKVFERDDFKCHYCKKQLTRFSATLDHIQPVSKGGDNSFDNLITACLHCNSQRGNRPVMDIILEKND